MRLSHAIWASAVIISTPALAQKNLTGTVTKVDEQKGIITIGGSSAAQEFKAQDGLLFNAPQPGDKMSPAHARSNSIGSRKTTRTMRSGVRRFCRASSL
jgi:hypothetical protein